MAEIPRRDNETNYKFLYVSSKLSQDKLEKQTS